MAVITSYSTLLTEVANWLARSNLTADIPGFIQNWEERFYRNPKNYGNWMVSSLSVSFSSTATVPADLITLRIAYLNGKSNRPLVPSSLEQVLMSYPRTSSGPPKWIARDGANFVFGPAPDGTYTLNGSYYAKPDLLRDYASDAAAHYLVVNAPDLLLYGALLEASPFIGEDTRIPLWASMYQTALADHQALMKAQNISGGSMQTLVV